MTDKCVLFVGNSGAGKSTLTSKIIGKNLKISSLSNDQGVHTTSISSLYEIDSNIKIIDSYKDKDFYDSFKEIYEKRNDEKIQLLDKNDYYLLFEVTKINKVLPSKSEIKFIERVKENLILKKKFEYNKDLFQKIQDKKFNNDEFVKISKNGENLLNETIKSLDDNSIFDKDSVSLIYSLPENSFVLLTNDNNKIIELLNKYGCTSKSFIGLKLDNPQIMGILNITPDSFSNENKKIPSKTKNLS